MISLDKPEEILKFSKNDRMFESIEKFGDQINQSWNDSFNFMLPSDFSQAKSIVICGMGGSRLPGLIIKELFKEEISVPFLINDDYHLPGFVNKETLLIASSYSGTTEEVMVNVKIAKEKGAKILGVTSGGELKEIARDLNFPCYVFNPIYNPSNQPRMGFGYILGAILGFMIKLGFLEIKKEGVEKNFSWIEKSARNFRLDLPESSNPAKQLARKLQGKFPTFIVAEFLNGAGNALANLTNETAKTYSEFRTIPELNHHLMEGLKHPEDQKRLNLFLFLYSSLYSQAIQKRFEITKEVVEKNGIETLWYELKGKTKIEQALEVLSLGSFLTFYLSFLFQEDPVTIPFVDYFKKRLKE